MSFVIITFRAFEYALWKVECKGIYCSVIGLYRPPQTSKTGLSDGQFIDEFLEMLAELMPKCSNLIIFGDLNFHWSNMQNPLVEILEDSIFALGMQQLVDVPTHKNGNLPWWPSCLDRGALINADAPGCGTSVVRGPKGHK